jgi:hypothetical protein
VLTRRQAGLAAANHDDVQALGSLFADHRSISLHDDCIRCSITAMTAVLVYETR